MKAFAKALFTATLPITLGLSSGLSFGWLLNHIDDWAAATLASVALASTIVWMVHLRRTHRAFVDRLHVLEAELKEYKERTGRQP